MIFDRMMAQAAARPRCISLIVRLAQAKGAVVGDVTVAAALPVT
jgi:hypothetical protein